MTLLFKQARVNGGSNLTMRSSPSCGGLSKKLLFPSGLSLDYGDAIDYLWLSGGFGGCFRRE